MSMPLGFIARNDLEGLAGDVRVAQALGYRGLACNYWGNFRELSAETVGKNAKPSDVICRPPRLSWTQIVLCRFPIEVTKERPSGSK